MKLYKKIVIAVFVAFAFTACSEDILEEVPLDFLSPENSFNSPEGIDIALTRNYQRVMGYYSGHFQGSAYFHYGTDLATGARNSAVANLGDYATLSSNTGFVRNYWASLYKLIYDSNVIITRIDDIDYPSESEKNKHIAEAKFFRGYAYKLLANLYGGVPIVLEEITGVKLDFVRATREEVYLQAIEDMTFAAAHLPGVEEVRQPGRVNNAAANHFLSELYISVGDFNSAVTAANKVINDPNIELMRTRFGNRSTDVDGDPYWDLFQVGNLNRYESPNKEGILVLQEKFNVPGGSANTVWSGQGFLMERSYGPLFWQLKDENGVTLFNNKPYTHNGGRPVGYVRPTNYFSYTIWDAENRDIDIRNNNRNVIRDWKVLNPNSVYYDQWASNAEAAFTSQDTLLRWYPMWAKATTKNDHPAEMIKDTETGELFGTAGRTYNDWYMIRLAETYLLRAEAKLGLNDLTGAAADINELRNRANALPVQAADIDIDYILDERLRELSIEEHRRMTLGRLNKVYDRNVLGNEFSGLTVQPHNNLWPIPFAEIEKNTGATLEQNPGYD